MQVMLQHTAGRLLPFSLFAFSLPTGGAPGASVRRVLVVR
jgi:hypothetical protein